MIVVVDDLDEAAVEFRRRFGLGSVVGGRHTGFGTANRIVPLGRTFVELLAVLDQEEFERGGLSLPPATSFAGWGLRTPRLDGIAWGAGLSVEGMSRRRADGVLLEWRIAGLEKFGTDPASPLVLDWSADDEQHPSRSMTDHDVAVEDIAWIEISTDRDIDPRLHDANLGVRVVEGPSAVRAVGLSGPDGDIELRFADTASRSPHGSR